MTKLLSCRYNMDTNRVEARFDDGSAVAIDCIAIEDEYGNAPAQQALGVCTDGAEWRDGTLPLPWLRTRQIRGLTLHRSNNSPALVKESRAGLC